MPSALPPGCSVNDIPGNRPEDVAWEALHELIDTDADAEGMTDMDAHVTWKMGLAAFKRARDFGALYHHDSHGV